MEGFGLDTIEEMVLEWVRATLEGIVEEELEAALGARGGARVGEQRCGYRHRGRGRTLTTTLGPTTRRVPRVRLQGVAGKPQEWRSCMLPRYQRRTTRSLCSISTLWGTVPCLSSSSFASSRFNSQQT